MTVLDFAASTLGRRITAAGGIGGECVDLADEYIAEVYGLAHVYADAVDWRHVTLPGWLWVPNGPTNAPTTGSLVVWGESRLAGTGAAGHIAVGLVADANHLVTLDQNWPESSPVALRVHDYAGVLGWLRPAPNAHW